MKKATMVVLSVAALAGMTSLVRCYSTLQPHRIRRIPLKAHRLQATRRHGCAQCG
jgi:hypothetical protein